MFNLSTPRTDQKQIPSNSINEVNVNESDPRSNVHYLGSSENKACKKIQAYTGFEPMTSAIPVQYQRSFK